MGASAAVITTLINAVKASWVVGQGGTFRKHHRYLTPYRGLAFYTRSSKPLTLPAQAEIIAVQSISIPEI